MPAKPGKSAKDVKQKYAEYVGSMTGPRTRTAMAKVLSVGMSYAKEYAPMEYGTLINSAYRRIDELPQGGFQGVAGFTVDYAKYLNGTAEYTPLWRPVAPEDKEGPAWNPFATPRFLDLGFTGPLALPDIQAAMISEYKK